MPIDEDVRELAKARKTASRREQVLESAQQRLADSQSQLAALQTRIELEKTDIIARTSASDAAKEELLNLECKASEGWYDADGDGNGDDCWHEQDHEQELVQGLSEEHRSHLLTSMDPAVQAVVAIICRKNPKFGATGVERTQPDKDSDICDMAVDPKEAEQLRISLNEAHDMQDQDEANNLRQKAQLAYPRHHPRTARVEPHATRA